MNATATAQFHTRYGDVYYGPIELVDGAPPQTTQLEQYAGVFRYDHLLADTREIQDIHVYQEVA